MKIIKDEEHYEMMNMMKIMNMMNMMKHDDNAANKK